MNRRALLGIVALILFGAGGYFVVRQPPLGIGIIVLAAVAMHGATRNPDGSADAAPQREAPAPPEGYRDVSMPIEDILQSAGQLALVLLVVPIGVFILLYGLDAFFESFTGTAFLLALPVLLVAIILHELIHAIGWVVFGRFSWRAMSFGIDRATLSPYAHANVPMTANAYRIGAALPGILTGIVPLLYGLIVADGAITLLGAFMTSAAVGDLAVLWAIRAVPGSAEVLDHPTNAGCFVKM